MLPHKYIFTIQFILLINTDNEKIFVLLLHYILKFVKQLIQCMIFIDRNSCNTPHQRQMGKCVHMPLNKGTLVIISSKPSSSLTFEKQSEKKLNWTYKKIAVVITKEINTYWSYIVRISIFINLASNILLLASKKYFLTSQGLVGAGLNRRALVQHYYLHRSWI